MHRVVLSAAVCVTALLVVSVAMSEPPPESAVTSPKESTPSQVVPAAASEPKLLPPTPAPVAVGTLPHGEKMIVKVYAVPDLVADILPRPPAPANPVSAMPELEMAMQQFKLQVELAQKAAKSDVSTPAADVPSETVKRLERLKKAIRVAAPKKSWIEDGGDGEIEVYSETLSLIVRQTASSHEAIADLLAQLRATQDIHIELKIESFSLEGVPDDVKTAAMQLLSRELSLDEVEKVRKSGAKPITSSVARMANGRTATIGVMPDVALRFTAVTGGNQSDVDFRTDLVPPSDGDLDADDLAEYATTMQAISQVRTVPTGKSLAFEIVPDSGAILLVTPKIIDRSAVAAK